MSLSTFYMLVGAALVAIFLFFKPMKVDIANPGEMPQIELEHFVVYDVTEAGVKTILAGAYARRFEDRYTVDDVNVTDRTEAHVQTMQADHGVYKEPIILLKHDVRYRRDDGVRFLTEQLEYNQSSADIVARGSFVLWQGKDRVTGSALRYNTVSGEASGKHIVADYELKENR